jgi:hypothetical protein
MKYECPICKLLPNSHSLTKVFENNDIIYFYSCPSQAILYYDVNGIVNHYTGVLSEIPENKEWIWIFDSLGFGLTHAMETTVAIELVKLISNNFSKSLNKIIIIHPTIYVTMTHTLLMPFMNHKIRNIIEINHTATSAEEIFYHKRHLLQMSSF